MVVFLQSSSVKVLWSAWCYLYLLPFPLWMIVFSLFEFFEVEFFSVSL